MLRTNQKFDEIRVVQGVAERTGTTVDRSATRGRSDVCRSITELARKVRSNGDGYFYLATAAWPESTESLDLTKAWVPIS